MRKEDKLALAILLLVGAAGVGYWAYAKFKAQKSGGTQPTAKATTEKVAPIIIVPTQPRAGDKEQGVVTGASGGTGTVRITTPPPPIPGTVRVPFSVIEPGTAGWAYFSPGQPYTVESPVTGKVYKVLAPAKEGGRTVVYEVR